MKRGIFIFSTAKSNFTENQTTGVGKKIAAQIKALSRYFLVEIDLNKTRTQIPSLLDKIKLRLPFSAVGVNWKYSSKYSGYDFVYFRKDVIDYRVFRFLADIKKHNPNCKVIVEIATYPYDKEILKRVTDIPFYLKDVINRNRFKCCVDRIVTLSNDQKIFGVETIRTINGIDFSMIKERIAVTNPPKISLIAVTSFAKWHGEDRLISGFNQYYNQQNGDRDIVLHLVGEGENYNYIKDLVEMYRLNERVVFHGYLKGNELDDVYDMSDIAINSLALHRLGLATASTLKAREYGAKGLPIVSGSSVDFISDKSPYFLKVPSDDTPIDLCSVITFYDSIYGNGVSAQDVADSIRSEAKKKCDIIITMQPICNYIQGE